jgi:hypothetical protein
MNLVLLQMAAKVEAAVQAYLPIQEFANIPEWKAGFQMEMVSANLHGVSIAQHLK